MSWTSDLAGLVGQATDATGTLATGTQAIKTNYDKVVNVFAGTVVPANTAATPGARDAQREAVEVIDDLGDGGTPFYKRTWFYVVLVLVGALVLLRRRR